MRTEHAWLVEKVGSNPLYLGRRPAMVAGSLVRGDAEVWTSDVHAAERFPDQAAAKAAASKLGKGVEARQHAFVE